MIPDLPAIIESVSPSRDINDLAAAMLAMPQAEIATEHEFCAGPDGMNVYRRAMHVKAGTLVLGFAHATACFNVLLTGEALVWCNGETKRVSAPHVFQSEAGSQKVGLFLTDATWVNFHATKATSVEQVEAEILLPCPALSEHHRIIAEMSKQAIKGDS